MNTRGVNTRGVNALLDVRNLHVGFGAAKNPHWVVHGVSFSLKKGETLALVGESGSGKTATALSILRLLPYPVATHGDKGQILYRGTDLLTLSEAALRKVRGKKISMIFQEPMSSLNPLHRIDRQIAEALRVHGTRRKEAYTRAKKLLRLVDLEALCERAPYPHELSGGQRQRVMIAQALALKPDVLIADEPTTALDVSVQAQILSLIGRLQKRLHMAVLLITHDLGIVKSVADRVCVMQDGKILEQGDVSDVLTKPRHPATRLLLSSRPKKRKIGVLEPVEPILVCRDVRVHYPRRSGVWRRITGYVKALDGVSFRLGRGRTLGVVGESGSGKTTLGLAVLRLVASQGEILFRGQSVHVLSGRGLRARRRQMQIVLQDPFGSLSPRLTVGQIITEGLHVHEPSLSKQEVSRQLKKVLKDVGLDPDTKERYPHEFSGGQRQRIAIARAIILSPGLVVLDEPTSSLDVSIQAQILELLRTLQETRGLAYLFISHDFEAVRALSHEIMVLYKGQMVEMGFAEEIFTKPRHAYTQTLIRAAVSG